MSQFSDEKIETRVLEKCYQLIIKDQEYLERLCTDIIMCSDPDIEWKVCSECSKIIIRNYTLDDFDPTGSLEKMLCLPCYFDESKYR